MTKYFRKLIVFSLLCCFCLTLTQANTAEAKRKKNPFNISVGTGTKIGPIRIGTSVHLPLPSGGSEDSGKKSKKENPFWQELLARYQQEEQVQQLIFVRQTEGSKAQVELYCKRAAQKPQQADPWKLTYQCEAILGENGLGKSKEGDKKTPQGDYGITMAMGFQPNPGTRATYLQMNEHTFCTDDPRYYNLLLDDREVRDLPEEKLDYMNAVDGPFFDYCLFIDYNKERTPGKGSYIFMHCGRELYDETNGCIALNEADMKEILKMVDDNVRVCIYPW